MSDVSIDLAKQALTKMPSLYMFSFPISNPGFDPKQKVLSPKPTHTPIRAIKSKCFDKTTMGRKDGLFELRVDCAGFLKDRQSHGGTVESSSACSVHHLIYLNLFFFFNSNSPEKQGNLSFFFTYRYVFS